MQLSLYIFRSLFALQIRIPVLTEYKHPTALSHSPVSVNLNPDTLQSVAHIQWDLTCFLHAVFSPDLLLLGYVLCL